MAAPSQREVLEEPGENLRYERGRLEHENALINQRLSWLSASQSFLAGAYGLTFEAVVPAAMKLVLPAIGLLSAALTYAGLLAAVSVFNDIKSAWADHFPDLQWKLVAGLEGVRSFGFLGARVVPPLYIGAWALAVAYEAYQLGPW